MKTLESPLLARIDLAPAASAFANACRASREWDEINNTWRSRLGIVGPHTSGIGHRDFPAEVQAKLSGLCETINRESDRGYSLRPRGVRMATMRALASAVAGHDGSGFYGPRA